ncbi:hypothetical protein, partial [Crocosphaera chwakensis]
MLKKILLTSFTVFPLGFFSFSVQAATLPGGIQSPTLPTSTLPGGIQLDLSHLFINNVTDLFNEFSDNFPISMTLNPGALGLPNPNTYIEQLANPINQLNLETVFSSLGGNQSLSGILQTIDFTEDSFLLDVAIDGQT